MSECQKKKGGRKTHRKKKKIDKSEKNTFLEKDVVDNTKVEICVYTWCM